MSSDKDFYQLLDGKTIIYSPTWKKIVTPIEVREKFKDYFNSDIGSVPWQLSHVRNTGAKNIV